MDARVTKLIAEFEQAGWKSHGSVDIKGDWWFDYIILLVSEWRPVGTPLYLTMLTDPQITDKKAIWSVGISSTVPEHQNQKFIGELSLNDIKKTNLAEVIKEINSIVLQTC